MKEQLYIAQQELESARTMGAHLHDIVREVTAQDAQDVTNIVKTSFSNKLSVNDLDEDNWTPVVHNFIKRTKRHTATPTKMDQDICSLNRFVPLSNLN
jgi:hypothetical protein